MTDARHVVTCNGRRVPLHPTGHRRRVRRRRALPRLAAAERPASDDSGARAAGVRPRRHLESSGRWAAARTTSRIRAGGASTTFPSTPTRPRAGGWRGSSTSATRPGPMRRAARGAQPGVPVDARSAATPSPTRRESDAACTATLTIRSASRPALAAARRLPAAAGRLRRDGRVAPGVLRPHCEAFVRSLEALGRDELASRWESARRTHPRERRHLQRLRRSAGRRSAVGARPDAAADRARGMEPARGGARAAGAAAQPDPGRPLRPADGCCDDGLLPPALVLREPGVPARRVTAFPCRTAMHLHLHAVDLARSPDGQWWVLADRTQAPSGAGYALENRIVLLAQPARSVPRLPGAAAGVVLPRSARHAARRWRRERATSRSVVLLTPGPLQRDLLRARLPRALPRLHARRRRRPDGARPPRLPQDARRPAAGRRRSSAGSTTASAIRSSCAAIRPSAWPAWWRRRAPATSRSPTRSARAWSRRRRSCRSCRGCAGTCSARS